MKISVNLRQQLTFYTNSGQCPALCTTEMVQADWKRSSMGYIWEIACKYVYKKKSFPPSKVSDLKNKNNRSQLFLRIHGRLILGNITCCFTIQL